jgi:hypothetical protein
MSLRQSQSCDANAHGNQAPVDISDQPKLNGQRSIVNDKSVAVDFMANGPIPQHEMRSDIDIYISAFTPGAALQEICAINDSLVEKCKEDTKWWEVIRNLSCDYSTGIFGLTLKCSVVWGRGISPATCQRRNTFSPGSYAIRYLRNIR